MAFLAEVTKKRRSPTRTPSCSRGVIPQPRVVRVPSTAVAATTPSCKERSGAANRGAGRPQFHVDHDWMMDMGESLPIFRPPLDLAHIYGERPGDHRPSQPGQAEVAAT